MTASHAYTTPGVREISLTVSDDDLGADRTSFQWVVVSDPAKTAGAGSVLAPAAELESEEGTFALDVATDDQGQTSVDFEFTIGGVVFDGVQQPNVSYSGDSVEIEGNVAINGVGTADNGMPYQVHISATDDPDTFAMRVWYLADLQGSQVETLVYETEPGQELLSGQLSVSEVDGTTGHGTILAPVADDPSVIEMREAGFAFVLYTDEQNDPVVDFEFSVGGFALRGLKDPEVFLSGNRVELQGGVSVGGEDTAPNGEPYHIRIVATDGPDTFQLRVWHLDENGVEQSFYETDADQMLVSGDVRVEAQPVPTTSPRKRNLREGRAPTRFNDAETTRPRR